ncbi:hypothetical protein RFI_05756 [Reticulomyxa filosa]|uniref:Inhibitor of growth protein N-terminal histone-binding domain-containing protein n=1 Tax=Reticulomyxa filosa TaxID=46433 RepID=X6NYG3_RETFI|nr:hypothetical protein RFI_05756 [Reticulomyxa filosa]|eukprot:ETO31360.1 hypothetical protein RFI_05756 [Reticulomyxa filosa]
MEERSELFVDRLAEMLDGLPREMIRLMDCLQKSNETSQILEDKVDTQFQKVMALMEGCQDPKISGADNDSKKKMTINENKKEIDSKKLKNASKELKRLHKYETRLLNESDEMIETIDMSIQAVRSYKKRIQRDLKLFDKQLLPHTIKLEQPKSDANINYF